MVEGAAVVEIPEDYRMSDTEKFIPCSEKYFLDIGAIWNRDEI